MINITDKIIWLERRSSSTNYLAKIKINRSTIVNPVTIGVHWEVKLTHEIKLYDNNYKEYFR